MKAVFVEEPFKINVIDVEKPCIKKPNEVLIKVLCGGICGSDIGIYKGTNSLATYPRIIGHEFGGIVEEIGSEVANIKVGDYVAVDPVRSCGHCYACTHNRHNVCDTLEVVGVHRDGGFSEYVVAPEEDTYVVDTNKVDPKYLCLVEPYSIGEEVNARGRICKDDYVLVLGSGPIGCAVMQVAKAKGATVLMTDLFDSRLERAKKMGADRTINVNKEKIEDVIKEYNNGEGMSVVVDSVCSVSSFEQALTYTCPAGRFVSLGLLNKPSQIASVSIVKKELDVLGSRLNNYRFKDVIKGFESHVYTPELMCTGTYPMIDAEKAMKEIMEHPEDVCKTILLF